MAHAKNRKCKTDNSQGKLILLQKVCKLQDKKCISAINSHIITLKALKTHFLIYLLTVGDGVLLVRNIF